MRGVCGVEESAIVFCGQMGFSLKKKNENPEAHRPLTS